MGNNTLATRVLINITVKVFLAKGAGGKRKGKDIWNRLQWSCVVEGLVLILNFPVVQLELLISYGS